MTKFMLLLGFYGVLFAGVGAFVYAQNEAGKTWRVQFHATLQDAAVRIEAINKAVQAGQPAADEDIAMLRKDLPIMDRFYENSPEIRNRALAIKLFLNTYEATQKSPRQQLADQSASAAGLMRDDPLAWVDKD